MKLAFLFVTIGLGLLLSHPARGEAAASRTYSAQGVIEKIDSGHHQLTIHHQAIPGYMMEMTMDFSVKDDAELKGLSIGDQINFNLVVDATSAYVRNLHRTGHTNQPAASAMPPENPARLQPGDPVPPSSCSMKTDALSISPISTGRLSRSLSFSRVARSPPIAR